MGKFEMPCDCGVCDECIARKENLHIKTDRFEKINTKPRGDDHHDKKEKTKREYKTRLEL